MKTRVHFIWILSLILTLALGMPSAIRAEVSQYIVPFQGAVAVKAGQSPLDASPYLARFTLYPAATGDSAVWQESKSITIHEGVYRVELGHDVLIQSDLFTIYEDLWLEIEINLTRHAGGFNAGDRFAPRQHLASAPYAFQADAAFISGTAGALTHPNPNDLIVVESGIVNKDDGSLVLRNDDGFTVVELLTTDEEGVISVRNEEGRTRVLINSLNDDGDIAVLNRDNETVAELTSVDREGSLILANRDGDVRALLESLDDFGILRLYDDNGDLRIRMDASGGVKNFITRHPNNADLRIVYTCLEGPEAAIYCRGTADLVSGKARIELPEHFAVMCAEKGMTVQVTPQSGKSLGLAVVERAPDHIVISELLSGTGSYAVDYTVMGVRKEAQDFQAVRSAADIDPKDRLTRQRLSVQKERGEKVRLRTRDQEKASSATAPLQHRLIERTLERTRPTTDTITEPETQPGD